MLQIPQQLELIPAVAHLSLQVMLETLTSEPETLKPKYPGLSTRPRLGIFGSGLTVYAP